MIDIETLRLHLGLGTDETYDELLLDWEEQAVQVVQNRTGRYFGPAEVVTEIIPGARCYAIAGCRPDRLYLRDLPLDALTYDDEDGTYDMAVQYGDPVTTVSGYTLRRTQFEAWLESTATWDARNAYEVRYIRGYFEGQEPADVRGYVIAWVKRQWELRGQTGIASKTMGGYSVTYSREVRVDPDIESLLSPWIRPVLA